MDKNFGMRDIVSNNEKRKTDVGVVIKTFELLEVIAEVGQIGLTALSDRTNVTKASANRILNTLVGTSYLSKNPIDKSYSCGPRLVALSCLFASGSRIVTLSRPVLEMLHQEFDETVNLGILNEASILYLDMIESRRDLRMAARTGTRDPLYCTALGKAVLSALPEAEAEILLTESMATHKTSRKQPDMAELRRELAETRSRGYALDDEENEPGARCVAVPIINESGRCSEAISVSAPSSRIDDAMISRLAIKLNDAARKIEHKLGYVRK
jgi:DNA-binding IclR family transcriptional regulator